MPPPVDVPAWLEQRTIGGLQILVLVLCAAAAALDGLDAQLIGYVAPAVIRTLHLPAPQFTPVFAAGLAGLLGGCLVVAPLADRVGRKRVMVWSTVFFGLMSLLTARAHTLDAFVMLRFATGLGLGGSMPNAIALTAEYFPARSRATMTMAMFTGFPVGAALGGLFAADLIHSNGWPAVFVAGGILPLAFAVILAVALPESIRHLVLKGEDLRVGAILERISAMASFPASTRFTIDEERAPGLTVRHLFGAGRALGTVLLWVMFFMSLLDIFFLSSWLPELLSETGLSLQAAVVATALLQGGGVVAALATGWMVDRFGFFAVMLPLYVGAGLAIALIGLAGGSEALIMLASFLAGACVIGGQTAANVLAAVFYPTAIRATGIGWALGIGRIGSIVGPVVGGALLEGRWGRPALFAAAAVPALVAALAVAAMAYAARGRLAPQRSAPAAW